jgi:hypothetical protein
MQFIIPYVPNKDFKHKLTKYFKKFLEQKMNKEKLIQDKKFLYGIKKTQRKEILDLFSQLPKTFATTLFVFDWLEYIKATKKLEGLSEENKIEYLQQKYPELASNTPKSLMNNVAKFKNFIKYISNLANKSGY